MLLLAGVVLLALLALNVGNRAYYLDGAWNAVYHFAVPAALALGCLALLATTATARLVAAIHLCAVAAALYLAEGWLAWQQTAQRAAIAARNGVAVDERGKRDVILALRAAGHDAYPATRAKALLVDAPGGDTLVSAIEGGDTPLLPLASVGDALIVTCNETGQWATFASDAHGFRNAPGAWAPGHARLALVGDSFVQGDCLAGEHTLAAWLARETPVLNLGVAGFGPLQQLAVIREYLTRVRPPRVAWFFYEGNDLSKDLPVERRAPLLRAYVEDPGFRQDLAARAGAVRAALAAYVDRELQRTLEETDHPLQGLIDFAQLFRLRERIGIDPVGLGVTPGLTEADFALLEQTLAQAQREIAAWGGRLAFVYLPDSARYYAAERDSHIRDAMRERVLAIVGRLQIPLIDVVDGFDADGRARERFHFPGSHYNAEGYARAAGLVAAGLRGAGLLP